MVERVATHECCLNKYLEGSDDFVLTSKVLQLLRTYAALELLVALNVSHISIYSHK
jgi:hypothetical protein